MRVGRGGGRGGEEGWPVKAWDRGGGGGLGCERFHDVPCGPFE